LGLFGTSSPDTKVESSSFPDVAFLHEGEPPASMAVLNSSSDSDSSSALTSSANARKRDPDITVPAIAGGLKDEEPTLEPIQLSTLAASEPPPSESAKTTVLTLAPCPLFLAVDQGRGASVKRRRRRPASWIPSPFPSALTHPKQ
jgi:hypothetical protein